MGQLPEELGFEVSERIARSAEDLYRAVTAPECSCQYFMVRSTGPLVAGASVTWSWPTGPDVVVRVEAATPAREVVLAWRAHQVEYDTRVRIAFEPDVAGAAHL